MKKLINYTIRNMQYAILSSFLVLSLTACKTSVNARYDYKSECLGVELDGSQTIKSWGKGRYLKDATDQAKKNAVRDVVFQGILDGQVGCNQRPLVTEVNAAEKYEAYFNKFFADGGEYTNFVSLKDEKIGQHFIIRKAKFRDGDNSVYSVVVRVLRDELKAKLISDGIIKQ
ncbi:hypothetical protein FACS1894178_3090 [Bacteroidia bacterium]|nr:hypothetical protein FACS1894178_3090 [Bacteroidia bacterium]